MKIKIFIFSILLITSSCFDVDYKGFIYSSIDVDERFSQSTAFNDSIGTRHLKIDSASYKFIVTGDSHVGGTENLKKMLTEVYKPEYSFFTICGDISTGHREDYFELKNTLDSLNNKPYYVIAGNHDLYFNGWETFYELFGSSSYFVEIETYNATDLLIFLDTGSATLGKSQTDWLENILNENRSNYRNCLIFTHVNFFRTWKHKTGATNYLTEEINYLTDLFYDSNIEIVFSGHDHNRYEVVFSETIYLTIDALTDTHDTPSYLVVENNDGEITYEFVEL